MTQNSEQLIACTQHWVSEFVISHNICPFAKREFDKGNIHYKVVFDNKLEDQLQALILACTELDTDLSKETSLIIYPNGLDDFEHYLDFLEIANALLQKQQYEGVYQLASFHPDYCFEGVDENDASNFTNRSPYPMLHLLRETSLEKALASYPNPEEIPQRNIEYTRELGVTQLKALLHNVKNQ
jgi:hypothetical protein